MSGGSSQSTTSQAANYDQRQVNTTTYDMSSYDLSNRSVNTNTTNTTTNADFSDRSTTNLWADSSNSNNTTNNSTTNADFSNRSNTVDSNNTTTNLWNDSSNRSVNTSTTNADFSNRSVTNTDNSNRSTNNTTIYNTTTDGGAVAGALSLAGSTVAEAGSQLAGVLGLASQVVTGQNASLQSGYDYADHMFNGALDAVRGSEADAMDAFSKAAAVQSATLGQLSGAYADAKGTTASMQKVIFALVAVAGLAVLARR